MIEKKLNSLYSYLTESKKFNSFVYFQSKTKSEHLIKMIKQNNFTVIKVYTVKERQLQLGLFLLT